MVVDFHMATEALGAPADSSCHLFSQIPWQKPWHGLSQQVCVYLSLRVKLVAPFFRAPLRQINAPVVRGRLCSCYPWSCFYSLRASCASEECALVPHSRGSEE